MKICLFEFKSAVARQINKVVRNSLLDLGHTLVEHSKAEIVIGLRDFSEAKERYTDKKYILFQIEQYVSKSKQIEKFYKFGPNEIWGFDIENEKEKYTPLGYHPCLLFQSQLSEDIDVGFFGWQRGRRNNWRNQVKYKWEVLNTFDDKLRGENISRARINLNIHFYEGSTFTEWGRIAYFLANEQFFISEIFYCPIGIMQFRTVREYDFLVDYFLRKPDERKEKARIASQRYKQNFDMRDILKERL